MLKPGMAAKVQGFVKLLKLLGEIAGGVKDFAGGAAQGMKGGMAGAAGALLKTALTAVLLRTVSDPEIRQILIDGLSTLGKQLAAPGFTLGRGVVAVLKAIAGPLGKLVARAVPDPRLRTLIATAATKLIGTLANESTVSRMMSNPGGYLAYLAGELVDAVKGPLADYLTRLMGAGSSVRRDIVAAITQVKGAVQARGIGALINFRELLGNLFPYLSRPLLAGLVSAIPAAQRSLKASLNKVIPQVGGLLAKIGNLIKGSGPPPTATEVGAGLAALAESVAHYLTEQIGDTAVRRVVDEAITMLVGAAKNPAAFKRQYLQRPIALVRKVIGIAGGFVKGKLASLLRAFPAEKKLLTDAIEKVFGWIENPPPTITLQTVIGLVLDLGSPYLQARLLGLVQGTKLAPVVKRVLTALFGPGGPFAKGEAGIRALPTWLSQHGQKILADVVEALGDLLQSGPAPKNAIVSAVARALPAALGKGLRYPGGLRGLVKAGAGAIFGVIQDAVEPIIAAITGGAAAGAQAGWISGFIRNGLTAIKALFKNPKDLAARGVAALTAAGPALVSSVKDAVKSFFKGKIPDPALKDVLLGWIDRFLAFASDPAALTAVSGAGVLGVFGKGASEVLDRYLANKIVMALPAPAQPLVRAILGEVKALLANIPRLKALLAGPAKAWALRALRVAGKPIVDLVSTLVPPATKTSVTTLLTDTVSLLSNAANLELLVGGKAGRLLPALGAPVQRFLKALLGGGAPAEARGAVDALAKVMSNPAAGAAVLQATRTAVETHLVPRLAQVSDPSARNLATGIVNVLKDLLRADGGGAALRRDPKQLVGRALDLSIDFAGSVLRDKVTDPGVQGFLAHVVDGARSFVAGAVGGSAATAATAFLPGAARLLAGLARDALSRALPAHAEAATMLGDLAQESLRMIADPASLRAFTQEGLSFLLRRVAPSVNDYLVALLRKQTALDPTLRGVLESLLRSVGNLLSDRAKLSKLSETLLPWLVSTVVRAVQPAVVGLVERTVPSPVVARLLRQVIDGIAENTSTLGKLKALVSMSGADLLKKVLELARSATGDLLAGAIAGASARSLATSGVTIVFDALDRLASGGAGDIGPLLRDAFGRGIALLGGFLKGKLAGLLGDRLAWLGGILGSAANEVLDLAARLISQPGGLAQLTAGGPAALAARVARSLLGIVREVAVQGITDDAVRGLVRRSFDIVGELLDNPSAVVAAVRASSARAPLPILNLLLPRVARLFKPLIDAKVVDPIGNGGAKQFVRALVGAATGLLERPERLVSLIDNVGTGNLPALARDAITGLASVLLSFIKDDGLRGLLESGVRMVAESVLGGGAGGRASLERGRGGTRVARGRRPGPSR